MCTVAFFIANWELYTRSSICNVNIADGTSEHAMSCHTRKTKVLLDLDGQLRTPQVSVTVCWLYMSELTLLGKTVLPFLISHLNPQHSNSLAPQPQVSFRPLSLPRCPRSWPCTLAFLPVAPRISSFRSYATSCSSFLGILYYEDPDLHLFNFSMNYTHQSIICIQKSELWYKMLKT